MKKFALNTKVNGFTLIEMLLALLITLFTATLLPYSVKLIHHFLYVSNESATIDFEFYSRDLYEELSHSKHSTLMTSNKKLIIKHPNQTINYIFQNHKIYKNINNEGNITMLNHVEDISFQKVDHEILRIKLIIGSKGVYQHKTLFL